MRIHICTDHAAFELKEYLLNRLREDNYEVIDHGAYTYQPDDDYPVFCLTCAEAVVDDPGSLGIVLGGSGNGEQIAANKVKGIRAILAYNTDIARLGREHNDANIISLGGRMQSLEEAFEMVKIFISTPFSGEKRHQRRVKEISEFENS